MIRGWNRTNKCGICKEIKRTASGHDIVLENKEETQVLGTLLYIIPKHGIFKDRPIMSDICMDCYFKLTKNDFEENNNAK